MATLNEIQILYLGNPNRIKVDGLLADSVQSGSPVNTASLTVTVVLSGGSTGISGASWPIGLTLVTSGTGSGEEVVGSRWEGVLPSSLSLTEGQYYQALVNANAGTSFTGLWRVPAVGKVREV